MNNETPPTHAMLSFKDLSRLLAPKPILSVQDLMERWSVSRETVYAHMDSPRRPLLHLPLSAEERHDRRLVRFRLKDVEEWEAAGVRQAARPAETAPPPGKPAWYTGEIHTGKKTATSPKKKTRATDT